MDAIDSGMTHEDAAATFAVGTATVYRWRRLLRETNSLEPRPHGGGQEPALSTEDDDLLRNLVAEKPDRTIAELTTTLVKRIKRKVSTSAVSRALARLGLTLKKKSSAPSRRRDLTFSGVAKSS
jgi:transposase